MAKPCQDFAGVRVGMPSLFRVAAMRSKATPDCRVLWGLFGRGDFLTGFLVRPSAIPWRLPLPNLAVKTVLVHAGTGFGYQKSRRDSLTESRCPVPFAHILWPKFSRSQVQPGRYNTLFCQRLILANRCVFDKMRPRKTAILRDSLAVSDLSSGGSDQRRPPARLPPHERTASPPLAQRPPGRPTGPSVTAAHAQRPGMAHSETGRVDDSIPPGAL
jgi:hypothetical protein